MPYKSEKAKIAGTGFDRRAKLNDEQREEICRLREVEGLSLRVLAGMFGVSKRLIQFIVDPEKRVENLKRRAERGGSKQYYNREEWAVTMREHRRYKEELYEDGKVAIAESKSISD